MTKIKKVIRPVYRKCVDLCKIFRRVNLKRYDFTIISNNCSGGYIYQYFGLSYNTPTVGLFFTTEDFLKLCENIENFLSQSLEFINPITARNYDLLKDSNHYGTYPVAVLGDIEVFFMHYKNKDEAHNKWTRRVSRVNYKKTVFLLTENEFTRYDHIEMFCNGLKEYERICLGYKDYNFQNLYVPALRDQEVNWTPKTVVSTINWCNLLNKL